MQLPNFSAWGTQHAQQWATKDRIVQLTNADAIDGTILADVASLLDSRLTAGHIDPSRGQAVLVQRALQRQQVMQRHQQL